jgi:hypothetical protein
MGSFIHAPHSEFIVHTCSCTHCFEEVGTFFFSFIPHVVWQSGFTRLLWKLAGQSDGHGFIIGRGIGAASGWGRAPP